MNYIAYPNMFWLLILPFIIFYLFPAIKGLHGDALKVPFIKDIEKISLKSGSIWRMSTSSDKFSLNWFWLYLIYALIVFAIARPQLVGEPIRLKNEGRDILLVMDISNSMLERDFAIGKRRIDRLTAVKNVASDFIKKRTQDRVGLILFATRAYLQSPVTYDKASVEDILWQMDAGMAGESTSIGDAVGLALKTLKDSKEKNKVLILLTDGENNDGSLSLPQVIKLAQEEGVKIYTIGVGSPSSFMNSFFGMKVGGASPLDEKNLKKLAEITQGNYFKATDTASLFRIYNEIDRLEPSTIEENYIKETKDVFYIPMLFAMLLALGLIFRLRAK